MIIASGVVAIRSQRSHTNYCNPSNLGHQFILILLISSRNIKREIKILHRKLEIGKILKKLSKTPILRLNPLSCINKNSFIVIGKNKQEKSRNLSFYSKPNLSNYCLQRVWASEALPLSIKGLKQAVITV